MSDLTVRVLPGSEGGCLLPERGSVLGGVCPRSGLSLEQQEKGGKRIQKEAEGGLEAEEDAGAQIAVSLVVILEDEKGQ